MKTIKDQLSGRCQHFTGLGYSNDKEKKCKAGISYYELCRIDELGTTGSALRIPCTGNPVGSVVRGHAVEKCDKYLPMTPEQIQAKEDIWKERERCLQEDISFCCKAGIDRSQVIAEGRYKNHGPRYCSKCKKLLYIV